MSSEYRIIHYVPDPFVGGRYPIAALLRDRDQVRVVVAAAAPDAECLGGVQHVAAIRMIVSVLDGSRFEYLPLSVGPQAVLDQPRKVPTDVVAEDWLRASVLPRRFEFAEREAKRQRATVGMRFFEQMQVRKYIRTRFSPSRHPAVLPDLRGLSLAPISQWVQGADQVLLLEPLVPFLPSFHKDLQRVSTAFGAYRFHLGQANAEHVRLYAYLLPNADAPKRHDVRRELGGAASVLDLSSVSDRDNLVHMVSSVGGTLIRAS